MSRSATYKHWLEYTALRTTVFLLNLLPVWLILLLCKGLGYIAWVAFPFRLEIAYRNISNVFPEKSHNEKLRLLRRVYLEVCQTFGLIFILHRRNFIETIRKARITGLEELKQAATENRGVILTTCHACWFEAYFAWFNMSDLPTTLIYQKQGNPLTDAFFIRQRSHFGNNLEHLSSKAKMPAYENALNRGRVLIVSLDQSYAPYGTPARFFGEKLDCAKGSAVLHLRTEAPVFTSVYYMKDGHLHIDFAKVELPQYSAIDETTINDISNRALKPYEAFIRRYPEQWFSLFHRLWSKEKKYYPPLRRTIKDIFSNSR